MKKEEKEAIVEVYVNYWTLAEKVRDIVIDALDALPITDVISVLDRIKIELVQQETMLSMDEEMQSGLEEETESKPINPDAIKGTGPDAKVEALLENIKNMGEMGDIHKEVKERINS